MQDYVALFNGKFEFNSILLVSVKLGENIELNSFLIPFVRRLLYQTKMVSCTFTPFGSICLSDPTISLTVLVNNHIFGVSIFCYNIYHIQNILL